MFDQSRSTLIQYPPGRARGYRVPDGVANIATSGLASYIGLTNATIPSSITNIGNYTFQHCTNLTGVYFQGNPPSLGTGVFSNVSATVYFFPWTTGWSSTFGGLPTAIWNPQSLVENGDFEKGALTSWLLVGSTNTSSLTCNGVTGWSAHSGRFGAFLGDVRVASLSQVLPPVPGQCYLLSLWLNNPTSGTNQLFHINWNTNSVATYTLFSITNPPAFSWTNLEFLVSATGTNTTLQIRAENDPNYFGLDDISVTPVPPPTFQCPAIVSNSLQLSWATAFGMVYQAQYKTNLLQTNWVNLTSSFVATNDSSTLLDTSTLNSSPQRFYRFSLRAP